MAWGGLGAILLTWAWQMRAQSTVGFERLIAGLLPVGWCHLGMSIPLFRPEAVFPAGTEFYYTCVAVLLTLEMLPLFFGTFTAIAVAKKHHDGEFQSLFLSARPQLEAGLLPLWILVQLGFVASYLLV